MIFLAGRSALALLSLSMIALCGPPLAEAGAAAGNTAAGVAGRLYRIVEAEASYLVEEEFAGARFNTAKGTTPDVTPEGDLRLDPARGFTLPAVKVDLRTLKTDQPRRDQAVQRTLGTADFPFAVFTPESAVRAPQFRPGQTTAFQLRGLMSIRGVEKPVVFDVQAERSGQALQFTATTRFKMGDFGVKPPSVAGLVTVDDGVKLEVRFKAELA